MKHSQGTVAKSQTICIGHGMGAHVCGMAGKMDKEHGNSNSHTRKKREIKVDVQNINLSGSLASNVSQ